MPSVLVLVLVVVLAWTVVLLPVFRHRDDALREARSYHLIASAARVVGRRRAASGDRRYLIMPRRTGLHLRRTHVAMAAEGLAPVTTSGPSRGSGLPNDTRNSTPAQAHAPGGTAGQASSQPPAPTSHPGRTTTGSSARQLRVLIGLGVLVALQLALAVFVGPGFLVGVAISTALMGGYVVALRRSAVQKQQRRRTVARARAAHPAGANRRSRDARAASRGPRTAQSARRPSSIPGQRSSRPSSQRPGERVEEPVARVVNG